MRQTSVLLLILILTVSALAGCAPAPESSVDPNAPAPAEEAVAQEETVTEEDLPEMTLEELSEYTGKDGQPAYVAVDGIVYDVSHLDKWKTGTHMNRHDAGQDLSEAILESPHGKSMLQRAIPVARLVDSSPEN